MPTLALPPQPPSYVLVAGAEELIRSESQGNGLEASQLSRLANEVFDHWSQRAELIAAPIASDDDIAYRHLLPNPSFVVKVRYKAAGRLQPRRFRTDD